MAAARTYSAQSSREAAAQAARHVAALTRSASSSFYWAMRLMAPERRAAMFAIYAFCRQVDDIADDTALPRSEKMR